MVKVTNSIDVQKKCHFCTFLNRLFGTSLHSMLCTCIVLFRDRLFIVRPALLLIHDFDVGRSICCSPPSTLRLLSTARLPSPAPSHCALLVIAACVNEDGNSLWQGSLFGVSQVFNLAQETHSFQRLADWWGCVWFVPFNKTCSLISFRTQHLLKPQEYFCFCTCFGRQLYFPVIWPAYN